LDGTATATFLADKKFYPTLIRFAFNQGGVMQFFKKILDAYNWKNLAVIYPESENKWTVSINGAARFFAPFRRDVTVSLIQIRKSLPIIDAYNDALTQLKSTARGTRNIREENKHKVCNFVS
jgi:Receptor family ligand binding region